MISDSYKYIFIHIPKTGGNSIQSILKSYSDDLIIPKKKSGGERFGVENKTLCTRKHTKIIEYYKRLDREKFNLFYKFTCIRNPWDRMVSFYFFQLKRNKEYKVPFFDTIIHEFFKRTKPNKNKFNKIILSRPSAIDFISTNNKIMIDGYIRFENIQEDFNNICNKIKIPQTQLPHINKSCHGHYRKYYDNITRDLVYKTFKKEIEYFGYTY